MFKVFKKITDTYNQNVISSAIVSLSAKVACADNKDIFLKKKVFFEIFKASKKEYKNIEKIFNLSSKEVKGYNIYANILYKKFKKNPAILEEILMSFFSIAKANGILEEASFNLLKDISKIFRISKDKFNHICNIHNVYDFNNPFVVLGISENISNKELKKHYYKLVKKYHPDSLISSGMPIEMISLLEEKMANINKAYKEIQKGREDVN
jgi:DnaJ like chaperone protein